MARDPHYEIVSRETVSHSARREISRALLCASPSKPEPAIKSIIGQPINRYSHSSSSFSMSCLIFGTTGLCGKAFLESAEKSSYFTALTSVTRRPLNSKGKKVKEIVEKDSDKYSKIIEKEKPSIVFSSLATTRGAAGSAKAFVEIDHGINLKIAQAAKAAGVDTFVIISSVGASSSSPFLYMKTKGRIEDDIIALKFPRTIILRPGPLLGKRDGSKGFLNDASSAVFKYIHGTVVGNNLFYPIEDKEVARAAVSLLSSRPQATPKPIVNIVGGKELLQIASTSA